MEQHLRATLAAAVTPLTGGGEHLDEDAFAPLLEFYGAGGVDGLLVLGTTGEGILLTNAERRRVAELAIRHANGLQIAVHAGAQTTAATAALAEHAAQTGAHAVAVIAPPYFALDEDELARHFTTAARACAPVPFYIYEYADRSGYAVPLSVIEAVRDQAPNLTGMKVSDAPFERVAPYLSTGLDIFIGAEALIPEGLKHGAKGAVSGVAAAFPEAVAALVADPTAEHARRVTELRRTLSATGRFQAAVKTALAARGVPIAPAVRAPLQSLGPEATRRLNIQLQEHLAYSSST